MDVLEIEKIVQMTVSFAVKDVLTTDEVADYLGITKSYLYKLTSRMEIPHYKPHGKMVFFNRKEIEEWAQQNRIAPQREINAKAAAYCNSNNL